MANPNVSPSRRYDPYGRGDGGPVATKGRQKHVFLVGDAHVLSVPKGRAEVNASATPRSGPSSTRRAGCRDGAQ